MRLSHLLLTNRAAMLPPAEIERRFNLTGKTWRQDGLNITIIEDSTPIIARMYVPASPGSDADLPAWVDRGRGSRRRAA